MKIAIVVPFYYPSIGGTENNAFEVAHRLKARNHDVQIFTTNLTADKKITWVKEYCGIEIVRSRVIGPKQFYDYMPKFKEKLATFNPDSILTYGFTFYGCDIASDYAKKYGKRLVVMSIYHPPSTVESVRRYLRPIYDRAFGFKKLKNAHKIIAICTQEKRLLIKHGVEPEKIEVVLLGVQDIFYKKPKKIAEFKKKYGINSQPHLLFLARIKENKGAGIFLQCYIKLKKNFPMLKALIVGPDGGYLPTLKKAISESGLKKDIIYTGAVPQEYLPSAYHSSTLFLYPTKYESFGFVYGEAMACGLPVVTTNFGGSYDLIKDDVNGYKTKVDDIKNMVEKCSMILKNRELRKKMSNNARKIAEDELRWNRVVDRIEKHLIN